MGAWARGAIAFSVFVLASSSARLWPVGDVPDAERAPAAGGQPDLKALAPRQARRQADFIGFWQPDRVRDCTPDLASRVRLTATLQARREGDGAERPCVSARRPAASAVGCGARQQANGGSLQGRSAQPLPTG